MNSSVFIYLQAILSETWPPRHKQHHPRESFFFGWKKKLQEYNNYYCWGKILNGMGNGECYLWLKNKILSSQLVRPIFSIWVTMIKIDIPLFECVEHYSYNTNQDHWSRIHLNPLRFTLSKFLKRKILIKVMYNPWRASLFQSKEKGHLRLNYYFAKPNSIQAKDDTPTTRPDHNTRKLRPVLFSNSA